MAYNPIPNPAWHASAVKDPAPDGVIRLALDTLWCFEQGDWVAHLDHFADEVWFDLPGSGAFPIKVAAHMLRRCRTTEDIEHLVTCAECGRLLQTTRYAEQLVYDRREGDMTHRDRLCSAECLDKRKQRDEQTMAAGEYLDRLAREVYGIERRESINGPHPETDEELRGRLEIIAGGKINPNADGPVTVGCHERDCRARAETLAERAHLGRERLIDEQLDAWQAIDGVRLTRKYAAWRVDRLARWVGALMAQHVAACEGWETRADRGRHG